MQLYRRQFLKFAGAAAAVQSVSPIAKAQTYPRRPITMIVPFAAGGTVDLIGRIVAEPMKNTLGQPIIVENVSGASGSIGAGRAARAQPDGYTIDLGIMGTHVLNGAFYSLQYDVLKDFVPIVPLARTALVLYGGKALPAEDLRDFIGWLKANPDKPRAATTSGAIHLSTLNFQKQTGTRFTLIPYRSALQARQDMVSGQVDFFFETTDPLPLARAGSMKAYAVTSDIRLTSAPDIPTFAEMGLPELSFSGWFALFAPKGTPQDIIDKLNSAAVHSLADPIVRSRLADLGMDIFPREQQTPETLDTIVKANAEKWWPIIKEFGIKAE